MTTSASFKSSPLAAALAIGFTASVYLAGCGGGESAAPATVPVTPTVALANGSVLGNDRDASGVLSFRGIAYAAAPVGDLRWRGPQAAPTFQGLKTQNPMRVNAGHLFRVSLQQQRQGSVKTAST